MTDFLVNKFIKDSTNIESTEVRTRYGMLASVVGIFCNVLLFSVKLTIGLILSSLAVTADAFNNLSDAASSIISFIGVKMAGKPADAEHPFGPGPVKALEKFLEIAKRDGYETKNVDNYAGHFISCYRSWFYLF